jgi:hypothetical protein
MRIVFGEYRQRGEKPFRAHPPIGNVPGYRVMSRGNRRLAGLHPHRSRVQLQGEKRCRYAQQNRGPNVAVNCHAVLLRRFHLGKGSKEIEIFCVPPARAQRTLL